MSDAGEVSRTLPSAASVVRRRSEDTLAKPTLRAFTSLPPRCQDNPAVAEDTRQMVPGRRAGSCSLLAPRTPALLPLVSGRDPRQLSSRPGLTSRGEVSPPCGEARDLKTISEVSLGFDEFQKFIEKSYCERKYLR